MALSPSTLKSPSPASTITKLDLSTLPPIFVSTTHLDTEDLHELEDNIVEAGGHLTYDLAEAKIILSKAERKKRIELDLRSKGLHVEEVVTGIKTSDGPVSFKCGQKRRRIDDSEANGKAEEKAIVIEDDSTASEAEDSARAEAIGKIAQDDGDEHDARADPSSRILARLSGDLIVVLKVQWFEDSHKAGKLLDVQPYVTYEGRVADDDAGKSSPLASSSPARKLTHKPPAVVKTILERAKADAPSEKSLSHGYRPQDQRRFGRIGGGGKNATGATYDYGQSNSKTQYAHLLHQTTSEYDQGISSDIPEMPDWVQQGLKYSCERITPAESLNAEFIELLKQIKLARLLTNDEIGVRAYSTSIASIAAYPHKLSSPREILALPGCDAKIANLFVEYANTSTIRAATDAETNEELTILRLFYNIWGVGATTAREIYYDRGWRDLDDIVEYGWSTLSRVQQIGVKYYSEFLLPIPRLEVEAIGDIITRHAKKVRDDRIQTCIVGGYRRGKKESGDVDIIVSHPDEKATLHIVNDIVASLEEEGWITHTLLLTLTSTHRNQQTLPFRTEGRGSGFDTLDKALVVWQDPEWVSKEADLAMNSKAKNPNVHRRVDIIISPWRTVGCAVAGWTSGTTFQRDLRRYCKNVKGWKFDSSGIRERAGGQVVDVEGWADEGNRAKDMVEAEKRVFEGLGLAWREPWERCTG